MGDLQIGIEVQKDRNQDADAAQHQERAEVDLPAIEQQGRLVEIEVVAYDGHDESEPKDLRPAILIIEQDVGVRAAQGPEGSCEAATDDQRFRCE